MSRLLHRLRNRSRDLLFTPLSDQRWRQRLLGTVRCLLYHRVGEPGAFPFLDGVGAPMLSTDELARDLSFLKAQGGRFLTFADLRAGRFPDPGEFGVIVSFDDGFRDAYDAALPVLDSLAIPGVVFQSSALVGADRLIWEHALYWHWHEPARRARLVDAARRRFPNTPGEDALLVHLRESVPVADLEELLEGLSDADDRAAQAMVAGRLYPSAGQLRQARDRGHEIGSHGHHHYKRASITTEQFARELVTSSRVLGDVLGQPPPAFSYPFNSYLPGDREACGRVFTQVATVDAAPIRRDSDPLSLPRYTWPGPARNGLRWRRWLWTGRI